MSDSSKLLYGSESDCVFQHQQTTAQSSKCPSWPSQVCRKTPNCCTLHLRSSWSFPGGGNTQRFQNSVILSPSRQPTLPPALVFSPSFQDGNGGLFWLFVWLLAPSILAHFLRFYPVVILGTGLLRSGFCQSAVQSASDQFQPKGPTLWSHCIYWLMFTLCFLRCNYYVRRGRKSEGCRHTYGTTR